MSLYSVPKLICDKLFIYSLNIRNTLELISFGKQLVLWENCISKNLNSVSQGIIFRKTNYDNLHYKKPFVNRFVLEINRHLDGNLVCDNTKESHSEGKHGMSFFSVWMDFIQSFLKLI